jgi:hypothetical protein
MKKKQPLCVTCSFFARSCAKLIKHKCRQYSFNKHVKSKKLMKLVKLI